MYIALTFDDGPNVATTAKVLEKLKEYNIKATFFVVGKNINESTMCVLKEMKNNSHEICSHSYSHSYMDKMTSEQIANDEKQAEDLIFEAVGEYPKFFRPPYIAVNDAMWDSINLPFICGFGSDDWDEKVTEGEVVSRTLEQACDGAIILLHDADRNDKTVKALDKIIPALLNDGYTFVTVSELFKIKNVIPEKYEIYSAL